MALFDVAKLQAQLKPLYNDFAYEYADEIAALARANMVYATIADKRKRNTGDKLRRITGTLFKSLGRNDPNNTFKIIPNDSGFTVLYGSTVPYAAIHEYGGNAGRNRAVPIPKRPYLNPALQKFDATSKPQFVTKIKFIIATEMLKWLERQKR